MARRHHTSPPPSISLAKLLIVYSPALGHLHNPMHVSEAPWTFQREVTGLLGNAFSCSPLPCCRTHARRCPLTLSHPTSAAARAQVPAHGDRVGQDRCMARMEADPLPSSGRSPASSWPRWVGASSGTQPQSQPPICPTTLHDQRHCLLGLLQLGKLHRLLIGCPLRTPAIWAAPLRFSLPRRSGARRGGREGGTAHTMPRHHL